MSSPSAKPCYLSGHTLLSQTALRWYISDQGSSVNEASQDRPITEERGQEEERQKKRLQYVKRRRGMDRLEYQTKAPRQGPAWECDTSMSQYHIYAAAIRRLCDRLHIFYDFQDTTGITDIRECPLAFIEPVMLHSNFHFSLKWPWPITISEQLLSTDSFKYTQHIEGDVCYILKQYFILMEHFKFSINFE